MNSATIILVITALLLCALLSLYLYLLASKWHNLAVKRQKQAWLAAHLPDIEAYLVTGDGGMSFLPRKDYQYEALEDYFSDYLSAYRIDPEYNPLKDFVTAALTDRYRWRLEDRRWSVRMNALYFIRLFRMENLQDNVLELLRAKYCTPEEESLIYIILAELQYDQLLPLFSSSKRSIPPFLLNQMLSRLIHQDNYEQYVDYFDQLPYSWKLSALDVFRDKNLRSDKLQTLLEHLLTSEDRELRLRALKTVGSLSYITSPDIIVKLWKNRSGQVEWNSQQAAVEKVMFARLMGNIKHDVFLPYLEQLITDQGYAVRSESARAIRKFNGGKRRLQEIAGSHADGYARNIAKEWLERSLAYE